MPNLLEVLDALGNFKIFLKACEEGGLKAMLGYEGDFTIFTPNDEAFGNMSSAVKDDIFKEPHLIMDLILHHCVEWGLTTQELVQATRLRTLAEDEINLKTKKKKVIYIEGSKILQADIQADNGILHLIDKVLIPPDLV